MIIRSLILNKNNKYSKKIIILMIIIIIKIIIIIIKIIIKLKRIRKMKPKIKNIIYYPLMKNLRNTMASWRINRQ